MQTLIDGATAVVKVTAKDETGAALVIAGWTVAAVWRAGTGVVPATPTATSTDANTWTITAPSTGLGGRACELRVTATDPVSGKVLKTDVAYLVEA